MRLVARISTPGQCARARRPRRDIDDLFQVVQHEQGRVVRELVDEDVQCRPLVRHGGTHRFCDAGRTSSGASIAASDTKAVLWEAVVQALAHGDGEPALTDAAGAGEGHQAHPGRLQQFGDLGNLALPSDQRRRGHRQRPRGTPVALGASRCPATSCPWPREGLTQEQSEVVPDQTPELRGVRNDR